MATTTIPFGHALARKVYGAAVFAEMTRKPSWSRRLFGSAPAMPKATKKLRNETSPDLPFVRITDLSRGAGDTVSVDLFNILHGRPTMGDKKIAGRMMGLTSNSMDIKLNQSRGGVDTGGRMTQQRTVHNLRTVGKAALAGWWARYHDQLILVHAAGARGDQNDQEWAIPLDTDPEFADIMVNSVVAPTYNRHFYGGDATAVSDIDAADIITLDTIDRLRASIDEMDVPLQPIVMPDDPAAEDEPMWVLYMTSRQWHYLQNRTGEKAWRTFLQNARERGSSNPLFKGTPGMWNGILIKKMPKAVRFNPGTAVTVATSADTFTTTTATVGNFGAGSAEAAITAGHAVDRALLLGAQGLATVFGRHDKSGTHMNWHEEETDHGNTLEASVAAMAGIAKLRFTDSNGVDFDHGIAALDSYAPDPRLVTVA